VNAQATTTVTVSRPGAVDDYTGAAGSTTVVAAGVPASIVEQTRNTQDPASGTPRTIRSVAGRVAGGTDVRTNDHLVDERGGRTYVVASARQPQSPVQVGDLVLELTRLDQTDP
jgi:hypothetical protein